LIDIFRTETSERDRPLASAKPILREWLLALTVMSLALAALSLTNSLSRLDQAIYDMTTRLMAPLPPDNVLIVTVDDASIDALGPWPWPAARHGAVIDALRRSGALAIGYDVALDTSDSDALAPALARARAASVPVAMPAQFRVPGGDGRAYDVTPPPRGALASHAMIQPDEDGVVRRLPLVLDGERRWPHMTAALLVGGAMLDLPKFVKPEGQALLVPREERLIGFRGGPGSFRSFPISAVLAGEVPRELIDGRVVLVGLTATGLGAQYSTATSGAGGAMPAIEISASLVADLLQGRVLSTTDALGSLTLALLMLWTVMVAMLLLRPGLAGLFGILLAVLVLLLAASGLLVTGSWSQPAAAVVAMLVAPPFWAWRRLVVVNDWMTQELDSLGDLGLPKRLQILASDPVTRTTERLALTIDRVQELRRLADAALRGLPDATLLVSGSGEIVSANGTAEALFGENPKPRTVEAAFKGNDLPPFRADALAMPKGPWFGEFRAEDGTVREVRYTPWRDANDKPLGWVVRFADISALRKAEAAREEALQLLTHDMRAPQASILALVDRSEDMPKATGDRLRALARRTISLADGYLQLARADAGGYPMDEVDLGAIATEAVDELWPIAAAKNVRIKGERIDREALSFGNASLLMRAMVNLLSNAVKHTPRGGEITVRLKADVKDWRVDVIDHGPGVSAEVQERLFGRFQTSGDMGGVGLGLAFVKSVADGHGGLVRCHSVPGDGAMFSLYLPGLRKKR
jgi:signal transduction histidine kinase